MSTPTADGNDDAPTVLFVDNFDSFTYNLVEYVGEGAPDADVEVLRNTASLEEVREIDPDAVVISPGPGHPKNERDVGLTMDVLREISPETPTLGVCLGLEAAVFEYGGEVGHAPRPIHGKAFPVEHDGEGVYRGLEQGFQAGRYHSLVARKVPDEFTVTATTRDDVEGENPSGSRASLDDAEGEQREELVMGVRHREYPIECVQFHPESVLTAVGHDVIRNFLDGALR